MLPFYLASPRAITFFVLPPPDPKQNPLPLPGPQDLEAIAAANAEYLQSLIAKAEQWGMDTLTGSDLVVYQRWLAEQAK